MPAIRHSYFERYGLYIKFLYVSAWRAGVHCAHVFLFNSCLLKLSSLVVFLVSMSVLCLGDEGLVMDIKKYARKLILKCGYDVNRFSFQSHVLARRAKLLSHYDIDLVLDIGANSGQYSRQLRELGYKGKIISFEPLHSAFELLCDVSGSDENWSVLNIALGDLDCKAKINVSENSYSSSLLDMLPSHIVSAPQSKYISKQDVNINRLDSIFNDMSLGCQSVYMKVDAQGYEKKILDGAKSSLDHISTVQLEMSIIPLYQDEILLPEMCMYMRELGYKLVSLEPGFSDPESGELLQVDGVFHREVCF